MSEIRELIDADFASRWLASIAIRFEVGLNVTTEEDGVVTMIDLEEIDLSAAPGTTSSARRIRAGKKFAAKIFANANARSIPSWKWSLAALRGKKNKTAPRAAFFAPATYFASPVPR